MFGCRIEGVGFRVYPGVGDNEARLTNVRRVRAVLNSQQLVFVIARGEGQRAVPAVQGLGVKV